MTHEAFVYCWSNITKGKVYVGYHKGTQDDGYICSSKSQLFWDDWKTDEWSRDILGEGTKEQMVQFEYSVLRSMDLKCPSVYNNAFAKQFIMTDEVRKKISDTKRRSKLTEAQLEYSKRSSEMQKGRVYKGTDDYERMYKSRTGLNNHNAKLANIYCYNTDTLLASDVCIGTWCKANGFCGNSMRLTASGHRNHHRQMYGRYISGSK